MEREREGEGEKGGRLRGHSQRGTPHAAVSARVCYAGAGAARLALPEWPQQEAQGEKQKRENTCCEYDWHLLSGLSAAAQPWCDHVSW